MNGKVNEAAATTTAKISDVFENGGKYDSVQVPITWKSNEPAEEST